MPGSAQPLDEGRFGPPLEGGRVRRGGPDWRRLTLMGLGLLVTLALAVGLTAGATILYGSRSIERVDVPELTPAGTLPRAAEPGGEDGEEEDDEPEIEEITDILNVLVVGSDSRVGLSEEQLLELGTEEEEGLRTDTIMLMQLDPQRDGVAVLSFPRDLLVTRCDGTRGRINGAYGIGEENGTSGARCLVQTVTDHTGIPVHHFVQVDFAGFIDIVDALGGVTLHLDEPIEDPFAGADFPAGCVTMTGAQALGFVRVRQIDSDFGRIARQQRFLREVVNEAASVGTLVNVPRLFNLVDAGARAVETDRELSLNDMRRIAFSLRDVGPEQVDTRVVPGSSEQIDGVWLVVPDEDGSEALFAAFRAGNAAPNGLGTQEGAEEAAEDDDADEDEQDVPAVEVDDVPPVTVLNGAGVGGLAGQAREQLEEQGFEVVAAGNADRFDLARTEVVHGREHTAEAEVLARALGGAVLTPAADGEGELVVILGADWEAGAVGEDDPAEVPTSPPALPEPAPTATFAGAEPGGSC